jgi:hypothetical protein
VLLTLCGVSSADVMSACLLPNNHLASCISNTHATLETCRGQAYADMYLPMLQVAEGCLQAGLDEVTTGHGSMSGYVPDGLSRTASIGDLGKSARHGAAARH